MLIPFFEKDLNGYQFYFANEPVVTLSATTTSQSKLLLASATSYPVRITAVDNDGNESDGVSVDAVTLLPNPTGSQMSGGWYGLTAFPPTSPTNNPPTNNA